MMEIHKLTAAFLLLTCLPTLVGCGEGKKELPTHATLLIEARRALAAGDKVAAMDALTASIDSQPNCWALLERAKLHLQIGSDQEAKKDCQTALQLEPNNRDVKWLQAEISKPDSRRFKGRHKVPPSYSK